MVLSALDYQIDFKIWDSAFAFPASVVDDGLKLCPAPALKVLLLILRDPTIPIQPQRIADALGYPAADVADYLSYWAQRGLLRPRGADNGTQPADASATQRPSPAAVQASELPANTDAERTGPSRHSRPERPPVKLQPVEYKRIVDEHKDLSAMLEETEALLGKTLTSSDISTLVSLYDWAGMTPYMILTVVKYCTLTRDRVNVGYIQRVALSWLENGVDSDDAADHYLSGQVELDAQVRQVRETFGIYDRRITDKERAFIHTWFEEYHLDLALIRAAYERTVENTGKLSFAYVNKILSSWHAKGIRTVQQAEEERAVRSVSDKPSFDIDEIERMVALGSPKLATEGEGR